MADGCHFYRATRMHSADYAVARCLFACMSDCRTDKRRYSVETRNGYTYLQASFTIR